MKATKILIFILLISLNLKAETNKNKLSTEEKSWLNNHQNLNMAIQSYFSPFQYVENYIAKGITLDILLKIEERLNYRFHKTSFSNWTNCMNSTIYKETDLVLGIIDIPSRRPYLLFSSTLISQNYKIYVKSKNKYKYNIYNSHKIACIKDYSINEFLADKYKHIEIITYKHEKDCLKALIKEEVDAFINLDAQTLFIIDKEDIENIHQTNQFSRKVELRIGIRKDYKILHSIINKAINSISHEEIEQIKDKWLKVDQTKLINSAGFKNTIAIILLMLLSSIFAFVIWNNLLKLKVKLKTKELFRAKELAIQSNIEKSSFLANMSHEIRTPLNAIQGFSHLLSNQDISQQKRELFSEIVQTNCSILTKLINDILDLSKIEAGQIEIDIKNIEIISLVQTIFLNHEAKNKNKEIKYFFINKNKFQNFIIKSDPIRIEQIINNLINNAEKFTLKGSISIEIKEEDTYIEISVCDTGIGIKSENIDIIFNRFTKIEKNQLTLFGGTGLGLAISKNLVNILGGDISVSSKFGQGSIFKFSLPK